MEFHYRELPVCPHCESEYDVHDDPINEYYEEGEIVIECNCGESFSVTVNVTFDYSTEKEDQEGGE